MRKISAIVIILVIAICFGILVVECIKQNYVTIPNRGRIEPKPDQSTKTTKTIINPIFHIFSFFQL